jgi:hypothetical protein
MPKSPEKKLNRYQRYNLSEKGKARMRKYNQSEKGRSRKRRYNVSTKGRACDMRYRLRGHRFRANLLKQDGESAWRITTKTIYRLIAKGYD